MMTEVHEAWADLQYEPMAQAHEVGDFLPVGIHGVEVLPGPEVVRRVTRPAAQLVVGLPPPAWEEGPLSAAQRDPYWSGGACTGLHRHVRDLPCPSRHGLSVACSGAAVQGRQLSSSREGSHEGRMGTHCQHQATLTHPRTAARPRHATQEPA